MNKDIEKLYGKMEAYRLAYELNLSASMEIARELGEEFTQFKTLKDQIMDRLMQRSCEFSEAMNRQKFPSEHEREGFNLGMKDIKDHLNAIRLSD